MKNLFNYLTITLTTALIIGAIYHFNDIANYLTVTFRL